MTNMLKRKTFKRKCKICGERFETTFPERKWCSPECGTKLAQQLYAKQREKALRKRNREERAKIKAAKARLKDSDKQYWLKKAQDKINKFIRLRDHGLPCIACGSEWKPNFQASHYIPRGRSSFLRYHEDNIHGGCVKCNLYESGNLRLYRIGLIQKIGLARTEWLEDNARHIKKWDIDELKEIIKEYEQKIKSIEYEM